MAGIFDFLTQGQNQGGGLLGAINNPLTLMGLGVLTGNNPQQGFQQGLAGLQYGYKNQREMEQERQQQQAMQQFNALLGGLYGQSMPAGTNPVPAAAPMGGLPGMTGPSTAGKIYENDEPSPLDPPSGADRDRAIRTVVAEAGNQGPVGMNAVASVIRNRAVAGNYGGDTASGVVTAPKQFEPWNDMSGRSRMAAIDPNSPAYQAAGQAVDQAYFGNDPTNGATHFYAPKAQAALGRPAPAWDNGRGVDLGDHRFFGGATSGLSMPQQAPQQSAQAPQQPQMSPRAAGLIRMLSIPKLPDAQRKIAETLLANELSQSKGTDDMREFNFAKSQGFKGTFEEWIQRKRSGAGEYSLNPVYGTNEKGETVLLQLGKSGEPIQTKLPPGVKVSSGVEKIDLGTEWGIIDKRTGNMVGRQPKDIEGREAAEVRGKATGTAQTALPNAIVKSEQSLKLIDEMIAHPGRETATGLSGKLDPRNYLAGTDATDFRVRQQQMQGRTFLEAFESLRGGGAITEIEGQKAEAAIARLNTAQSDKAYVEALNELKTIITKGMQVARQKAGGNFSDPAGWQDMGNGVRIRQKQ